MKGKHSQVVINEPRIKLFIDNHSLFDVDIFTIFTIFHFSQITTDDKRTLRNAEKLH